MDTLIRNQDVAQITQTLGELLLYLGRKFEFVGGSRLQMQQIDQVVTSLQRLTSGGTTSQHFVVFCLTSKLFNQTDPHHLWVSSVKIMAKSRQADDMQAADDFRNKSTMVWSRMAELYGQNGFLA